MVIQPSTGVDIVLDKYHALEGWTGDPYVTQRELATRHDIATGGPDAMSARSPAAFLVESLSIPIPDRLLPWFGMLTAIGSLALAAYLAGQVADGGYRPLAMLVVAYLALVPGWVIWFNLTDAATPLLVAAWLLVKRRKPGMAGATLGAAAAIKLWPGVIVLSWILRRDTRLSGLWAVLTGAALTVFGLVMPGVTVKGTVESLQSASDLFGSVLTNVSLLHLIGWPALVVASLVFTGSVLAKTINVRMALAILAGLLGSPIVWPHYWLTLLPGVVLLISFLSQRVSSRRVAVGDSPPG